MDLGSNSNYNKMKKLFVFVLVSLLLITTISAVWYNPFTWFSSSAALLTHSASISIQKEYKLISEDINIKEKVSDNGIDTKEKVVCIDDKGKETTIKEKSALSSSKVSLPTDCKYIRVGDHSDIYQIVDQVILNDTRISYNEESETYNIDERVIYATAMDCEGNYVNGTSWANEDTLKFGYDWENSFSDLRCQRIVYESDGLEIKNHLGKLVFYKGSDIYEIDASDLDISQSEYECSGEDCRIIKQGTDYNIYEQDGKLISQFYSNSNVDPTFTITQDIVATGLMNQVRAEEGNFSHLEINYSQAPYDGLVLYMPFDYDTSTAFDFSNSDDDGSYVGTATLTTGLYDDALEVDGTNDYVNIPYSSTFDTNNNLSFSFWFNSDVTINSGNSNAYGFISRDDAGGLSQSDWSFVFDGTQDAGRLRFGTYGGNIQTATNSWTAGTWYHITVVHISATNSTIYVNGVIDNYNNDYDAGTIDGTTNNAIKIGVYSSPGRYFNGKFDEVMVFNKSLTQDEITAIYNNQSARYYSEGNQTLVYKTMTTQGDNRVNMSVNFESILDSSVEGRVGYWDTSDGYNISDAGLVSYWTGDGDAVDELGINNGTLQGNANASEQGVFNNSFSFDGAGDYINASSLGLGTSPFTINVWVNVKEFTTYSPTIISQGDSGGGEWFMYFDSSDRIGFQGDLPEFQIQTIESYTNFVGEWIMITVVREEDGSSDNGYLYVNTILRDTDTDVSDANFDTGKELDIGVNDKTGLGSWYFNGSIDDIMIFNRTLSATEIKELYVKGRANWNYPEYQTLTSGVNSTFTIDSTTTNLLPELKLNAGNSSDNPFYSPIVYGSVGLDTFYVEETPATPSISLDVIYPEATEMNVTQNEFFNVTVQVNCLTGTCGTVNVSLDPAPKVEYTPTTRTECDAQGICTKTLYSGTTFVYEDGKWKGVEEARSLKGTGIKCNVNYDGVHIAECVDWNYTSKTIKVKIKDNKDKDKDIPIKNFKNEVDAEGNKIKVEEKNKEQKVKFTSTSDEQVTTIQSAYGDEVHFGEESTTIQLQDANTENLDDSYMFDQLGNDNYGVVEYIYIGGRVYSGDKYAGIIKYDLTQLPENTKVINSESCLYLSAESFGTSDDATIGIHHVYNNFSWNEETITWNNGPSTGYYNETYESSILFSNGVSGGWYCWNTTKMVVDEVGTNLTIYFLVESSTLEAEEKLTFVSKEGSASLRPNMSITYDSAKSGLIPEGSGTPFYTNNSNPRTSGSLSAGQSENITFWVNATGSTGIVHDFFAFANTTTNETISNTSSHWNVTIIIPTPPEDTSFTVSIVNGYTEINFTANNKTVGNLDAVGQDSGNAVMSITNTGDVDLDIYLNMNETATGFTLLAGLTNDPTGAKIINTTFFVLKSALASSSSQDIWLWLNWTEQTPTTVQRVLNSSVQIN